MFFEKLINDHQIAIKDMTQQCLPDIQAAADICREAVRRGNTVFLCGNGGSAADAQHIAAEFVGRFVKERCGLPAVALTTDTSILTAVGNDYGFATVFQRQVAALARTGDVVIGISTSGNSQNILLALEAASAKGAFTVALTGGKDSKMSAMANVTVKVPHNVTARIQECHILIGHMICEYIDEDYA